VEEIITDFKPVEEVTGDIITDFKPVGEATDSDVGDQEQKRQTGAGGSFADYETMPMGEVGKEAVESFPESAKQVGRDIASVVKHPIETAKGIGNIGLGIVQKLIPGRQGKEQYIEAIDTYIRDRYGSIEGIKEALATDPAGVAFDLFSLLTPAGAASKLGIAKKAGKAVGATAGTLGKAALGMTTGIGSGPIRKAFKGGKAFRNTMTRKVLMEEVVENANSGLRSIANERRAGYRKQLTEIRKSNVDIDISPIRKKLNTLMSEEGFNIKRVVDEKTGIAKLDFSRSSLDKTSHAKMKRVIEKIDDWGSQSGDLTASGLDLLKKNLDDFYSKSSNSRAFITSLKGTVKKTIIKEVPEYAEMTAQYEKYMKLEKNISQSLSIGDKKAVTTSIRSLNSAMKQDVTFRKDMIRRLQDASGIDLEAQIAGALMTELVPSGFIGRSLAAGSALSMIAMGDPKLLIALSMTSPRVMGEFLSLIAGPTSRGVGKAARVTEKVIPEVTRGAYIAGKSSRVAYEDRR